MSTLDEQLMGLPVTVKAKLMRLVDLTIGLSQAEKAEVQRVLNDVAAAVDDHVHASTRPQVVDLMKAVGGLVWAGGLAADGRDPHAVFGGEE